MSLTLAEAPVVIADGLGFPEGPVWMPDKSLVFVDIEKQALLRLRDGKVETVAEMPGGPNGAALGPDGAIYVCNNGGVYGHFESRDFGRLKGVTVPSATPPPGYTGGSIQRVDLNSGQVTTLYDYCAGERLLAPDDIVFDRSGHFWFTTSGYLDGNLRHMGGLYYASVDGKRIRKVATIPTANGVGLSPDGTKVYVSDTIFGRLWAIELVAPGTGDVKPGLLEVMPGQVIATLPGFQWLDSLAVEADGRVCVGTLLFTMGITVFGQDGTTEHVTLPDPFTTNLCFGGDDMCDVWITASGTGKIYKARWPRPGLKLAFHG